MYLCQGGFIINLGSDTKNPEVFLHHVIVNWELEFIHSRRFSTLSICVIVVLSVKYYTPGEQKVMYITHLWDGDVIDEVLDIT